MCFLKDILFKLIDIRHQHFVAMEAIHCIEENDDISENYVLVKLDRNYCITNDDSVIFLLDRDKGLSDACGDLLDIPEVLHFRDTISMPLPDIDEMCSSPCDNMNDIDCKTAMLPSIEEGDNLYLLDIISIQSLIIQYNVRNFHMVVLLLSPTLLPKS